ncbi:Hydantoinase/oxoprolinase N-terminal region [Acididesulfobacillus acetoxydans]|uniref:Hydantoinase/oxoprolinase N-terminal region n=1 Tax=Acididesulfobacillus acetoxydans TaxID=1561005 RepID=A0A8S0XBB6_9FIRM|nr:hydantoinase/oxoprolinase family protein [Acididesulfobacillus acetoxydans]CAA7601026.1 Hydantoinase/oxoprolinase N-terminal region [Acididesulfobacillus acetoxydans]CEJ06900.1 N-methylhydantoinase A/acetone carboxylase, beta subunit [Acididesulfobacillus acetoxydans]
MPLALGIDTGGTYTDGVLLELKMGKVQAKAKSFTTHEDLTLGIRACIDKLGLADWKEVALVSLSTTLATNAIVEGRGCRVGLILIGHEPSGELPAQEVAMVGGGHDIKGNPQAPLDLGALLRAIRNLQGKVDTLAISGFLSIRNPEHELQAWREVRKVWRIPVVCAHQLTTALGFHERTVTACLNARLLPIVAELLTALRAVLSEKDIEAPVMVVKGDGSLMSEAMAREKPIETILSGPAASIVGAMFLSGRKRALVLDMGGTTTDIALINGGQPSLHSEGATVGGWKTRVEAAAISTFGLGGDSYLWVSREGKLSLGPQRVLPLAAAAARYPHLADELAELSAAREVWGYQPVDSWILIKKPAQGDWTESEWQVIRALQDGAHNIFVLAERLGRHVDLLPLARLEQARVVGRISLTPTDLLHATGKFTPWNMAASLAAARLQAGRLHLSLADFLALALAEVRKGLVRSTLQSLLNAEGSSVDLTSAPGAQVFLERFWGGKAEKDFSVKLNLAYPIVAIGAPVEAYLPPAGETLNAEVVIPEHAEVANAVGAAVGQVVETVHTLIKPGAEGGFVVYTPWAREGFQHLSEAEEYAVKRAREAARRRAVRAGAVEPQIIVDKKEALARTALSDDILLVETSITARAIGRPAWRTKVG